jgi:3-mercaptopyruvate sulfurtransferase SseA
VTAARGGAKETAFLVMDDVGGRRAVRAKEILEARGFGRVVVVEGGANAWKSAWDSNMRRRRLPGAFSRGFDNPMFADSNVVAEEFAPTSDDTVWIV